MEGFSDLQLWKANFTGNIAGGAGGALYVDQVKVVQLPHEVQFAGNRAEGNGGAVFLMGATDVSVVGCRFSSNSAGGVGGAMAIVKGA